jgi:hypothetical protein
MLPTDTHGAIHILTEGKKLEVNCFIAGLRIAAPINSMGPNSPPNQQSEQQQ